MVVKPAELLRGRLQRARIAGDIPPGRNEMPVSEIPRKKEEAVRNRGLLPDPLRDQLRRKGVPQIHEPRSWAGAVRWHRVDQSFEDKLKLVELNGPTVQSDEKPFAEWEGLPTHPLILLQRTHDRWVQRQFAKRTGFGGQDAQQAGERIEINEAQSDGFGGAQAGRRDQSDNRRVRAVMKRRVLRRQGSGSPQNRI